MLTWDDRTQKDQSGKILSVSYTTRVPHWGVASVHPDIRHPNEMFLDCPGLSIKMHPLGKVSETDALNPAETVLMKTLAQHGIWCLEALVAIGSPED